MIDRTALAGVRRIASRANPRLKEWAGLRDKANRDALGLTLAEGAGLVAEGLDAAGAGRFPPRSLLVSDSGADRPEAGGLLARARELGIETFNLADDCFAKLSGLKGTDGLALVMSFPPAGAEPEAMFSGPDPRWLAAVGVQDPGNAGALARTALAAGFTGCLFLDGADPHSPKFLRGGMGAAFRLPCLSSPGESFLARWRPGLARVLAAANRDGAGNFRSADYSPPLLLLIGGERGLPREFAALADHMVRIPLRNGVESLNLAVAAGILLFEASGGH